MIYPALCVISSSRSRVSLPGSLVYNVSKTTIFTDRHIFRNTLRSSYDGARLLRCFRPNKKGKRRRYQKIVSLVINASYDNFIFTKRAYDFLKFQSAAIANCH